MRSLKEFINESKHIVLLSYINRLKEKIEKNPSDEKIMSEVIDELDKYYQKLSKEEVKSIVTQLGYEYNDKDDRDNKGNILQYINGLEN